MRKSKFDDLLIYTFSLRSAHYPSKERRFSRSDSVPNLTACNRSPTIAKQNSISPTAQRIRQHHRTSKKDRIARGIRGIRNNKSIDDGDVCFINAIMFIRDNQFVIIILIQKKNYGKFRNYPK